MAARTAKNDWGLLNLRASMLYHQYEEYAPVRTKRYWLQYLAARHKKDIRDAFLVTEAFRLSFKRV